MLFLIISSLFSIMTLTIFISSLLYINFFYRPYDGRWSKTMVGYGAEDDYFVVELTYNYGIKNYTLGNDFKVRFKKSFFEKQIMFF